MTWVAKMDAHTCDSCLAMNGGRFVNPPNSNCRSMLGCRCEVVQVKPGLTPEQYERLKTASATLKELSPPFITAGFAMLRLGLGCAGLAAIITALVTFTAWTVVTVARHVWEWLS